jgi:hypothetical protein
LNVYDKTATTCANGAIIDPSFEFGQPTQGNPPWTPINSNVGGEPQYDFANTAIPPGPRTGTQYGSILWQNNAYRARYYQAITVCANTVYNFQVYQAGQVQAIPLLGVNPDTDPDCQITYYIGPGTAAGSATAIATSSTTTLNPNTFAPISGTFDSGTYPTTQRLFLTIDVNCIVQLARGPPIGGIKWDDFSLTSL